MVRNVDSAHHCASTRGFTSQTPVLRPCSMRGVGQCFYFPALRARIGHCFYFRCPYMQENEDHVNHSVSNAYTMLLRTSVRDLGRSIGDTATSITRKPCNVAMTILDFLAAATIWFQSIADESSSLLPIVMPCWPGRSDYGPPEVESDDTRRRPRSRKRKLLKIKESLKVKSYVNLTSYDHHDCPVCLSEFCDNDVVYELPHCKHIFHERCLNQWLRHGHTTCPFCRSSLQQSPVADTRITRGRRHHAHQV